MILRKWGLLWQKHCEKCQKSWLEWISMKIIELKKSKIIFWRFILGFFHQLLEYYLGGFCSFGPKKRQKNISSVVSSGHLWEVCWGSEVRFPVWPISLFEFFSYLSVIFYVNSTSKTMPLHATGNNRFGKNFNA